MRPGIPRRYRSLGPRVLDDLVAQVYAFKADRHTGPAGTGDQHVNLRLCFTAETAFQVVAIRRRLPFIAIRHQTSLPAARRQPRPAEQSAPDPVPGLEAAVDSVRRQVELRATLGATRTNGIAVLRTYPNSGQERTRGSALFQVEALVLLILIQVLAVIWPHFGQGCLRDRRLDGTWIRAASRCCAGGTARSGGHIRSATG